MPVFSVFLFVSDSSSLPPSRGASGKPHSWRGFARFIRPSAVKRAAERRREGSEPWESEVSADVPFDWEKDGAKLLAMAKKNLDALDGFGFTECLEVSRPQPFTIQKTFPAFGLSELFSNFSA